MFVIKLCSILRGKNALLRSVYHGVHDLRSCYLAESIEICMAVTELSHLFGRLSFAASHNAAQVAIAFIWCSSQYASYCNRFQHIIFSKKPG